LSAGILHTYRDKAGFEQAARDSEILAKGSLEGQYYGGFFTESDTSGDIHQFTTGLAKACERMGVNVMTGTDGKRDRVEVLHLDQPNQPSESLSFDAIVISAGVPSSAWRPSSTTDSTFNQSRAIPSRWNYLVSTVNRRPLKSVS